MSIQTQLDRLRKAMTVGMNEEDHSYLSILEKRIKELEDFESLGQRPAIRQFIDYCVREVKTVNDRLSTDVVLLKDGREGERLAMINRKEIFLYFISLFNTSADLESLERQVSAEAENFEGYQSKR